jgi:hypothetical protein
LDHARDGGVASAEGVYVAEKIHAHPTFAEAVRIATEDALGHAIDL